MNPSPEVCAEVLEHRFDGYPFFEFAHEWGAKQLVPIKSDKEFIFATGGNSAGKTCLGSWITATRFLGFCPVTGRDFRIEENRSYRIKPYNIYVVGTTEKDIFQRLQPALAQWLPPTEYTIDGKTGDWVSSDGTARIMFKTVSAGARTFQGDEIDFAWIDEHPERKDVWNEILARIGRRLGQVLVTMTAWQGVYWLWTFMYAPDEYPQEHKCITRIPLDANPYWTMCNCGRTKRWHPDGGKCVHPDSRCPKYNPSVGEEKLKRYRKKWRGIEFKIRFEGHYMLKAGQMVIDSDTLDRHMEKAQVTPMVYGYFNDRTQLVTVSDPEDERALIRICKPPVEGRQYVCGFDAGGGNPTGDYHAAVVLDCYTGQQVATMHSRNITPRDIAFPLVQLCRWYNDAYLVPEVNHHGGAVLDRVVVDLGYGMIYKRHVFDSAGATASKKLGFLTDKRTKSLAVDLMVGYMQRALTVLDPMILHEMYGFLYLKENREGKFNIGNGNPDAHDDLCMAMCMACVGMKMIGTVQEGGVADAMPPPPPVERSIAEEISHAHETGAALGPEMSGAERDKGPDVEFMDLDMEMLQQELEVEQYGDDFDD